MITVGSDFSGVGAFNQALIRLGIDFKEFFACDMDKYARQTFVHNYGEPDYYPENVYDRAIPTDSLDIYMTSPPCQAFSLAGKRKGEDDKRGVLFYNSHEFIKANNPRYFIFENVKGLLSDDGGKTFQRWIDMLGGKTVNGNSVIFPHEEAVPYHVYYQVMNAKHYGVPQNRERIFIIGIRDDADNNFSFPKPYPLVKRLKDILEREVDEKYFLSDKAISDITGWKSFQNPLVDNLYQSDGNEIMTCLTSRGAGETHSGMKLIQVKLATSQGYEIDPLIGAIRGRNPEKESGCSNVLTTVQKDNVVVLTDEVVQLNPSTESGGKQPYQQNRVYADYGVMTCLDTDSGKKSVLNNKQIRRLTPRECFRLMDFPDTFTWPVSDSQAYKQAGNSIVVNCLVEIIRKFRLD